MLGRHEVVTNRASWVTHSGPGFLSTRREEPPMKTCDPVAHVEHRMEERLAELKVVLDSRAPC